MPRPNVFVRPTPPGHRLRRGRFQSCLARVGLMLAIGAPLPLGVAQVSAAAASGRVAAVDVVRVFNEYQRQKDLQEEMRKVQDRLQLESDERRKKIDQLQAQLDALKPSDPTYTDRSRELLALQIDYKNWFDINQAALTREIGVWTVACYRDILRAVELLAERDGFDLVFYKEEFEPTNMDPQQIRDQIRGRKLLYARQPADITQLVLDKLNADYRAQPPQPMIKLP